METNPKMKLSKKWLKNYKSKSVKKIKSAKWTWAQNWTQNQA